MAERPASRASGDSPERVLDGGFWLVLVLAVALLALVVVTGLRGFGSTGSSSSGNGAGGATPATVSGAAAAPSAGATAIPYSTVQDAPPLVLTEPDGQAVSLASMRGGLVLVFFGYTHCPDVCPATIGIVEQVMAAYGPGIRTLFVTVDPERDTTTWLKEFDSYRSSQFTSLTGSDAQIKATADAWDVKYCLLYTSDAADE